MRKEKKGRGEKGKGEGYLFHKRWARHRSEAVL
jgi:hypothetical protein